MNKVESLTQPEALKVVHPKFKASKPLWKPITTCEREAYEAHLIYAGFAPCSSYNGWRKDYEK